MSVSIIRVILVLNLIGENDSKVTFIVRLVKAYNLVTLFKCMQKNTKSIFQPAFKCGAPKGWSKYRTCLYTGDLNNPKISVSLRFKLDIHERLFLFFIYLCLISKLIFEFLLKMLLIKNLLVT